MGLQTVHYPKSMTSLGIGFFFVFFYRAKKYIKNGLGESGHVM